MRACCVYSAICVYHREKRRDPTAESLGAYEGRTGETGQPQTWLHWVQESSGTLWWAGSGEKGLCCEQFLRCFLSKVAESLHGDFLCRALHVHTGFGSSADGMWLPTWWGHWKWSHMQSSHHMDCTCTCTCTGACVRTGWPSECSAEECYNNSNIQGSVTLTYYHGHRRVWKLHRPTLSASRLIIAFFVYFYSHLLI